MVLQNLWERVDSRYVTHVSSINFQTMPDAVCALNHPWSLDRFEFWSSTVIFLWYVLHKLSSLQITAAETHQETEIRRKRRRETSMTRTALYASSDGFWKWRTGYSLELRNSKCLMRPQISLQHLRIGNKKICLNGWGTTWRPYWFRGRRSKRYLYYLYLIFFIFPRAWRRNQEHDRLSEFH